MKVRGFLPFRKELARSILFVLLGALSSRLKSLHYEFPSTLKIYQRKKSSISSLVNNDSLELFGFIDLGVVQPIQTVSRAFEQSPDLSKGEIYHFLKLT